MVYKKAVETVQRDAICPSLPYSLLCVSRQVFHTVLAIRSETRKKQCLKRISELVRSNDSSCDNM